MMKWRRKIKGKKKVNNANGGGKKLMENEAKKQKERETMKWRAKISAPTLFNSPKAKSTQKKFSFPSLQFHILNAQNLKPEL